MEVNGYDTSKKSMSKNELDVLIAESPYYNATSNDVDWMSKIHMQGNCSKMD